MGTKVARILSAVIEFGEKVIELNESDHKAILSALMILLGSAVNHSDAESSGKVILEFLADVKRGDLKDYNFTVTDGVKSMSATGDQIIKLADVFSVGVVTEWHVERGGSRAGSTKTIAKLGSM